MRVFVAGGTGVIGRRLVPLLPDDGPVGGTRRKAEPEAAVPLIGGGTGYLSWVHVGDAARPPRRVPAWLLRLLAREMAVGVMTEGRGLSNAKAKRELGWVLRHPSWRQGFEEEVR